MSQSFIKGRRRLFQVAILVFGLALLVTFVPGKFTSEATSNKSMLPSGDEVTRSHEPGLEYYDIRMDKAAAQILLEYRQSQDPSGLTGKGARNGFRNGEAELASRVPNLKVEFSPDLGAPEVIGAEAVSARFLSGPTVPAGQKHASFLSDFLRQNNSLIGLTDEQVSRLKVTADYTNPDGNLSFVHFEQEINGIPVFRGEVKAGFTKDGQIIRVINNVAPGLDYDRLSRNAGRAEDAVIAASRAINHNATMQDLIVESAVAGGKVVTFERGHYAWPTTAEQMYFPLEPGVARLAWRVLLWEDVAAYYVIVDAETGRMLWRKNISEDQTESATFNVYTDDSPTPFAPGPNAPTGFPPPAVISRTNVTLIGNEAPNTFNNNGWITDGGNTTDGNNVEAGIDRDGINGVDAPVTGTARVFNFAYNPWPGNPAPGESPLLVPFQNGASTNLFYLTNRYHDSLYLLGFTEAARNFQQVNFTGMGLGNDRVSAEAQDSSGTNNANFNTPADGGRGRMQMYLWTSTTPNRDGDLDADIVYHELTHGTSNRLHFNASGLGSNLSRAMGEGWSDFYAHCLLSTPADPLNGIYTLAAYSTNQYYYGIRRFPKAIMSFTGGPLNRPHNPMTFADIDSTQINLTNGAFAPRAIGGSADQVHNAGEIWSSALWEIRALMITRLGAATGNTRVLQVVTDGMKLAPSNPTFLQERDAIIAAAGASSNADVEDVLQGFAIRGMGFGARVLVAGGGGGTARVIEAFDMPNLIQGPTFSFSDAPGNNNGLAEPGENLLLTVPVQNIRGISVTGVTVSVNGGMAVSYGDMAPVSTATRVIPFTVPSGTPCGSVLTLTFNINSSLGPTTGTRSIQIGIPTFAGGTTQNFDGVVAPALPSLWTQTNSGAQLPWVTTTTGPDTAPNSAFGNDGTSAGESSLITPLIQVNSASASLTFRRNYSFEAPDWDAMVLEISIAGGAFNDILAAGGSFVTGGYTGTVNTTAGNPLAGRMAWIGTSGGYQTTTVNLPASANGQIITLRWRIGTDAAVGGVGANIDTVSITGAVFQNGYACPPIVITRRPVADFDGDGRTDLSVYRSGTWYIQRSTAGFIGVGFGLSSDTITPGDFDGDGKADIAVFRTNTWYILRSSDSTVSNVSWGASGDLPRAGDYDGDGKTDVAVYRPSSNTYFALRSSDLGIAAQTWGVAGDVPLASDFDGDGKTDFAVFRSGTWHILGSFAGYSATSFGLADDRLVPADYDGDNKEDIAVFRSGTWYLLRSTLGFQGVSWGLGSDTPVPGDYDGDGKDDVAVFRGSTGTWHVVNSGGGTTSTPFGTSGDVAVPAAYIP